MHPKQAGRRRFLTNSGRRSTAVRKGVPLGADTTAVRPEDLHAYGERTHFENSILDYAVVARVSACGARAGILSRSWKAISSIQGRAFFLSHGMSPMP